MPTQPPPGRGKALGHSSQLKDPEIPILRIPYFPRHWVTGSAQTLDL